MGHIARLCLICDVFIAICALRRHLDSVALAIPIRDIVDRCRVWESHADTEARRFSKPGPERALPIYVVDELGCGLDDRMVAAVTIPPAVPDQLETLLRRLLPNKEVPVSPPKPVPTELESLLQRLLEGVQAPEAHSATQNWDYRHGDFVTRPVSGMPATASRARPGPIRRDLATVVCFSCGKVGHGMGRCPELNETFPFMLLGWMAEKVGSSYVMIWPQITAYHRRAENGD